MLDSGQTYAFYSHVFTKPIWLICRTLSDHDAKFLTKCYYGLLFSIPSKYYLNIIAKGLNSFLKVATLLEHLCLHIACIDAYCFVL